MRHKSLAGHAAELATKTHKIQKPLVLDCAEALHPKSGKPVYRGEALEATHELAALFDRHVLSTAGAATTLAAGPVTIQPDTNVLTLNPGDTFDETITVTIPKNAGPARADIYFLADTTGSMGGILNAVQVGANNILAALNGLGADLVFGVGNYRDFLSGDPYAAVAGGAAVTEASATAKLVAQGIKVLAISIGSPGLDDDPKNGESGYDAKCGPPGGAPGQGTRIAGATGGQFVSGINAANIVNTIISLVSGAVGAIQNVKLVPSAGIASFVTSITRS